MREWQPIATAPKDMTEVDLWVTDPRFPDYEGGGYRVPDCAWIEDKWRMVTMNNEALESMQTPTHWMDQPEPPK